MSDSKGDNKTLEVSLYNLALRPQTRTYGHRLQT